MDYYNLPAGRTFLVSQKAIIVKDGKLLVLRYLTKDPIPSVANKWGLPGGLLELDENLEDGLKREVLEETGLKVTVGEPFAVGSFEYDGFTFKDGRKLNIRVIEIAYVCTADTTDIQLSAEHEGFSWVTKEQLSKFTFSPDSAFALEKYCTSDL